MKYGKKSRVIIPMCTLIVMVLCLLCFAPAKAFGAWRQDEFIISTFQGVPSDMTYHQQVLNKCKELGLNTIETYFITRNASHNALTICDQIGLKVVVNELDDKLPLVNRWSNFQNKIYGTNTDASVADAISFYSGHPSLYGYCVWDEPFPENIPALASLMNKFKVQDGNKLALCGALSYDPEVFADAAAWRSYINDYTNSADLDVLGMDKYPFHWVDQGIPLEDQQIGLFEMLGYDRLKALQKNVPMWCYIQSVGDVFNCQLTTMTVDRIRLQAYCSIAYGAKALSLYNVREGLITNNGAETSIFQGTKKLLSQIKKLGPTLMGLKSTGIYHSGSGFFPYDDKLSDQDLITSLPDKMTLGTFADASGRTYIMPVNLDYNSSKSGSITFNGRKDIYEVSKSTGTETLVASNTSSLSFNYLPGEGALYRVYSYPVASTPQPEVTVEKRWQFDTTAEGWISGGDISGFGYQTGGYIGGTITGIDPAIFSVNNLGLNITDNKIVKICMNNNTNGEEAQIFFTTNSDTAWNEAKSKRFKITRRDQEYTVYTIDMSTVPGWTGTLKQLRIDPNANVTGGTFSINSISIQNTRSEAWGFDTTAEGWVSGGDISGYTWQSGGCLSGSVTGIDPMLFSENNLGASITNNKKVLIRMKNQTASTGGALYFTTDSDPVWSAAKSKNFSIIANDPNFTIYTVDMSDVPGWMGRIKQLRFDPNSGVTSGWFNIDFIRLQNGN